MDTTDHDEWAQAKLAALLQRLALQGAAELMDEALAAYRQAQAMVRGER